MEEDKARALIGQGQMAALMEQRNAAMNDVVVIKGLLMLRDQELAELREKLKQYEPKPELKAVE